MAVTAKQYGLFITSLLNKEIDIDTDTIKVMLCTSAYTPDQDAHRYKSSVTNEITGTGYTAGGVTLTSLTVGYTTGTNVTKVDAADAVWAASTLVARYAVAYDWTPGSDATRPLISYVDFGADVSTTAADFTIAWDAAGIATLTTT